MSQEEAFEFEQHFCHPKKAKISFPPEALRVYEESRKEGLPTAFSDHPEKGKAVICSAGQGPMVIWREKMEITQEMLDDNSLESQQAVLSHLAHQPVQMELTPPEPYKWQDNTEHMMPDLKKILMEMGNLLVVDYGFNSVPPKPNDFSKTTIPLVEFSEFCNGHPEAREALKRLGFHWSMPGNK